MIRSPLGRPSTTLHYTLRGIHPCRDAATSEDAGMNEFDLQLRPALIDSHIPSSITSSQLIMLRLHLPKLIRTLIRRCFVDISSLISRNLRIRANRFVRRLGIGLAAEHRDSLSVQLIRCFALLDPVDERVQSEKRESSVTAHAVHDAGYFEVAEVVVHVGGDFFHALVVVETAVWWDEFVGETGAVLSAWSQVILKGDVMAYPCHKITFPPASLKSVRSGSAESMMEWYCWREVLRRRWKISSSILLSS